MNLQSQVALVTGANRGIGRALVQALLKAGAKKIYSTARSSDKLAQLPSDPRIIPLQVDVSDTDSVAAMTTAAPDVSLLVNNAGVLNFGPVLEAPLTAFERNFATNFYGVLHMSRAFAPVIGEVVAAPSSTY